MIRNKNLIFIALLCILSGFASMVQASAATATTAATTAAATAAVPAVAQTPGFLATADSTLGHLAGLMKNGVVVIGVPTALYYGYQWLRGNREIKDNTDKLLQKSREHGLALVNHGQKLKVVGEDVAAIKAGTTPWQTRLLQKLGFVETAVTTLQTDVSTLRADTKKGFEDADKNRAADAKRNADLHADTQRQLKSMENRISALVIANGVPGALDRISDRSRYFNGAINDFALGLAEDGSAPSTKSKPKSSKAKKAPTPPQTTPNTAQPFKPSAFQLRTLNGLAGIGGPAANVRTEIH